MFTWDGSDISEKINDESVRLYQAKWKKRKYFLIEDTKDNSTQIVLTKTCKNALPCLIDELKPAFGLPKVGTHWFKMGAKLYIIYIPLIQGGDVIEEITLKDIGVVEKEVKKRTGEKKVKKILMDVKDLRFDETLKRRIRNTFIFRELLGVSQNFEKHIILRRQDHEVIPISFDETDLSNEKADKPLHEMEKKVLPDTIIERWFGNMDLNEATAQLLNVTHSEQITTRLSDLHTELQIIQERLAPDKCLNVCEILTRIRGRLQFAVS